MKFTMKYTEKLQEGIFLKRYKRFFADIEFQGQVLVAHCPNTGSMKSINNPRVPCLFSLSDNPERKLKYTLEMLQAPSGEWVGVNTATPNLAMKQCLSQLVKKTEIFQEGPFAFWSQFDQVKPEYKISSETRLDFALSKTNSKNMHFIEVKNVSLAEADQARFPDAVTERGQKHLLELMNLIDQGHSAEIVFFIHRGDCNSFAAAADIDPEYAKLMKAALDKGVRITPLVVQLSPIQVDVLNKTLSINW